MQLTEIEEFIVGLFDSRNNDCFHEESRITVRGTGEIKELDTVQI